MQIPSTHEEGLTPAKVAPTHRRRIGLSLRVLMVLVLVLGGGSGWMAYRARVQRQAVAAIVAAGGKVCYDWEWRDGAPITERAWPKWLVDFVGVDFLGRVVWVYLNGYDGGRVDREVMVQVGRLAWLEGLWLPNNASLTDDRLLPLSRMTQLKYLALSSPNITDAGLAHLEGLHGLKSLSIGSRSITNVGLVHLSKLRGLKTLNIMDCGVDTLKPIEHLTRIEDLSFYSTPIGDDAMATVAGFQHLKRLVLFNTKITDAGLAQLAPLANMERLGICGAAITDAGIATLAKLPRLTLLNLDQTKITDDGMLDLAKLKGLTRVSLEDTKITDAGLLHLALMPNNPEICLRGSAVTPEGISAFRNLRNSRGLPNRPTPPPAPGRCQRGIRCEENGRAGRGCGG